MTLIRTSALALAFATGSAFALIPQVSQAQVFVDIRVRVAPPPLPVYVQPPLPGPDYIWTPGYWAWDGDYRDYFWVPGTWVLAPRPGYLWTPSYWGWDEGVYVFHGGYWGPHIGYYGGVNYGFGYTGFGFEGGYWNGPHFFYNRAVNNVTNVNITNVYNKTVIVNRTTVTNVSYSGGPGGVVARPTQEQMAAEHESHIQATPMQAQHMQAAQSNRALFASANHGAPPVAASVRPAQFSGTGVVRAERAPAAPAGSVGIPGPMGRAPAARPGPRNLNTAQPAYLGAPERPPVGTAPGRAPVNDGQAGATPGYPRGAGQPPRQTFDNRPQGGAYPDRRPGPGGFGDPRAAAPRMAPPPRAPQPRPAAAPRPAPPPRPHPEPHGEPKGEPRREG